MSVMVISGVTSGLGLELARHFSSKGWNICGLARNLKRLKILKAELGDTFDFYQVDISISRDVANVFSHIKSRFSLIDVMINNAAVFKMAPFSETSIEDIDRIIDTNLKGSIYCTHSVLEMMRPKLGRIINIGSVAGEHGIKNQSVYCASKFGLDGFAQSLHQELNTRGINITTICPGGIDTPLWNLETNPYPGGHVNQLLDAENIIGVVDNVINQPSNVVVKKVVLFPSNEWH